MLAAQQKAEACCGTMHVPCAARNASLPLGTEEALWPWKIQLWGQGGHWGLEREQA